jgi:hypothetical protein
MINTQAPGAVQCPAGAGNNLVKIIEAQRNPGRINWDAEDIQDKTGPHFCFDPKIKFSVHPVHPGKSTLSSF